MNQIIITVSDLKRKKQYDLEVPTELEVEKLLDDIIQTLTCYDPILTYSLEKTQLFSLRKGSVLDLGKTLKMENIRNGDNLIIQ